MYKKIIIPVFFIICFNFLWGNSFFESGVAFFNSGDYRSAAAEFRKSIEKNPQNVLSHYYLGISLSKEDNPEGASFHLSHYLEKCRGDEMRNFREAFNELVSIYRSSQKWEEIAMTGEKLIHAHTQNNQFERHRRLVSNSVSSAYLAMGNIAIREREYEKAENLFLKAIDLNPLNPNAHERLGRTYFFLGRREKAETHFTLFLESGASNWRLLSSTAFYLLEINKGSTEVIEEKIRDKNPVASDLLRIYRLLKEKEYAKGFNLLENLEEITGTGGNMARDIVTKMSGSEDEDALILQINFGKHFPFLPHIDRILNNVLSSVKREEPSEETVEDIKTMIEKIISKESRPEKLAELDKFIVDLKLKNKDGEGIEYYMNKIEAYSKLYEKHPESVIAKEAIFENALIYLNVLGDEEKGEEILKTLAFEKNFSAAGIELGRSLSRKGKYEKGLSLLEVLSELYPEDDNMKLLKAEILIGAGRYDEGVFAMREIESSAENREVKNIARQNIGSFREIETGMAGERKDFLIITLTETETVYSPHGETARNTPFLRNKSLTIELQGFSSRREKVPMVVNVKSSRKPSLTEPPTIFRKQEDNEKEFFVSWNTDTFYAPDRWRPNRSHSLIFPWEEWPFTDAQIQRTSAENENTIESLIEIIAPPENSEVRISSPAFGRRQMKPEPLPDKESGSFISYMPGQKEKLAVMISFPKRQDIFEYYPEVLIIQKQEHNEVFEPQGLNTFNTDKISISGKEILPAIILLNKKEKIIRLNEKAVRR